MREDVFLPELDACRYISTLSSAPGAARAPSPSNASTAAVMARRARFREALRLRYAFGVLETPNVTRRRTLTRVRFGLADGRGDIRAVVGLVAIVNPRVLIPITSGSGHPGDYHCKHTEETRSKPRRPTLVTISMPFQFAHSVLTPYLNPAPVFAQPLKAAGYLQSAPAGCRLNGEPRIRFSPLRV